MDEQGKARIAAKYILLRYNVPRGASGEMIVNIKPGSTRVPLPISEVVGFGGEAIGVGNEVWKFE